MMVDFAITCGSNDGKIAIWYHIMRTTSTKITKLWKDVENLSCYHTQKSQLDTCFVTVSTVMHSWVLMYFKTATNAASKMWIFVPVAFFSREQLSII